MHQDKNKHALKILPIGASHNKQRKKIAVFCLYPYPSRWLVRRYGFTFCGGVQVEVN